jgi:hypothetical protein
LESPSVEIAHLLFYDLAVFNYFSDRKGKEYLTQKTGYANSQLFLFCFSPYSTPPALYTPAHLPSISFAYANSKGRGSEMCVMAEGSQPQIKDFLEIVPKKISTFDY